MRDNKSVLAVATVLVVVVGFVVVANLLTAPRSGTTDPTPLATSQAGHPIGAETPTQTSAPTPTPSALEGCQPVPPLPTAPIRMDSPPDPEAVRGKSFVATVTTNCGDIVIDLNGAAAPAAVASFVELASANYWVGTPCHRLTTEGMYVVQCGDPTGTGAGPGPGYHFGVENVPADGQYPAGSVAMARNSGDTNSNKDQFFFVYQDTTLPVAEGGYTLFGQVTSGLDLLQRIAAAGAYPPGDGAPLGAISILSVSVQPKA